MAEITIPIKLDISYIILDALRKVEADRDDYMYMQGFYDCRDSMIEAVERFIEEHIDS